MNKLKTNLAVAAALAVLAIIGTIMNSQHATAQQQGPPDGLAVRLVSPLPVPVTVTGSSTISGTVAATQSGTWNVNTKNVDERGRIPYQVVLSCISNINSTGACAGQGVAVDANRRLVIEHVSAQIQVSTGKPIEFTELHNGSAKQYLPSHLENFNIFGATDTYYVNEQVLSYLEAGQQPNVVVQTTVGSRIHIIATLSGYIVNLGI